MNELYIAVCLDRHIDPVIRVFDTKEKAINCAKKFATENARFQDDIKESNVDGWLYHCTYSVEVDYVFVVKTKLNDES